MNIRRISFTGVLLVAATALWAGVASAHHSFAMFDFSKDVTLLGVIKEFRWINPHIHILIETPDGKGGIQVWDIEGQTPNTLRPQGWSSTTLQPGDKVSLVVHPLKSGAFGASLVRALRPDGSPVVAARPAPAPRPGV